MEDPRLYIPRHPLDLARRDEGRAPEETLERRGSPSERASEQGVPKTCNYGPGVHQAVPPPPPVASRRSRPTSSVSLFISVSFLRLSPTSLSRFSIVSVLSPCLAPLQGRTPASDTVLHLNIDIYFEKLYLLENLLLYYDVFRLKK